MNNTTTRLFSACSTLGINANRYANMRTFHLAILNWLILNVLSMTTLNVSVASDLSDVPQAWYSLDGSHVVAVQKDGDTWYAQISKSDGSEVLWGTETERPLCGCVSADGKAIALLTGTLDSDGSAYSQLKLSVIDQDERTFHRDLPGTTLVEASGPHSEASLALAKLEFSEDQPVVTFVSAGRVVGRLQLGKDGVRNEIKLPTTRFRADSSRDVVAKTTEVTWRLADVSTRPAISKNHIVAPLSTGMMAACLIKSLTQKDQDIAWQKLTSKRQTTVPQKFGVDDWVYGLKAAGCFGWQAPQDVVAPEISKYSLRQGKFLLSESPTEFWTRQISVQPKANVLLNTHWNLPSELEASTSAIDEQKQLPSVEIRRSKLGHREISLESSVTFSSEWAYPFNAASNIEGEFRTTLSKANNPLTPSTSRVTARFMKGDQEFCRVAQLHRCRVARIPLLDGHSVLFLSSNDATAFGEMDAALFRGELPTLLAEASWSEVKLTCKLPIFALSQKLRVEAGLETLIDVSGRFESVLNSDGPLNLKGVSQSVRLQLDEDGVSAAPSTTVNLSSISRGESLTIDGPFHVCILADGSDFPIVIARVISPEVGER